MARYRFLFRAPQPLNPRGFAGSAWRGVFGHALKKTVCITRCERCTDCLLYYSCVYPYIFETPPPPGAEKLRNYSAIPHPFLLDIPWRAENKPSNETELGLSLFGRGNLYVAYVVHAFRVAGEKGVQWSPPLRLTDVLQEREIGSGHWDSILTNEERFTPAPARPAPSGPMPNRVRISFVTPCRLRHLDRYIGPDRFTFGEFFRSLLSRLSALQYFHTDSPLKADFAELTQRSKALAFSSASFEWTDWTRFSSRQSQKLQMGGVTGHAELELDENCSEFWPFLWLGQWTHTGKGTSMGLGAYRLDLAPPRGAQGADNGA